MASTYRPTLDEVRELAAQGNFVAIYRDLPADLETPVSVYLKLCGQGSSNGRGPSFLLESVEKGEQLGRYSFIGVHPPMTVTSRGVRSCSSSSVAWTMGSAWNRARITPSSSASAMATIVMP